MKQLDEVQEMNLYRKIYAFQEYHRYDRSGTRRIQFIHIHFLNKRHPNIRFTTEKQMNHSIAFLDVFISGINNQNLTLKTYHKLIYTGLFFLYTSNLQGVTIQQYKNKKILKCKTKQDSNLEEILNISQQGLYTQRTHKDKQL